jgi:hypothetical protein
MASKNENHPEKQGGFVMINKLYRFNIYSICINY